MGGEKPGFCENIWFINENCLRNPVSEIFLTNQVLIADKRFGLGYTYDWGLVDSEIGASEFIIKQGSEVTIKSVQTTAEYCAE